MPSILETLQPQIDTLNTDGDTSVKSFATEVATLAAAYDSGSFTKLPEFPDTTDADILKAVFSKSLIDAQVAIEASGESVAAATTEIHTAISSLS